MLTHSRLGLFQKFMPKENILFYTLIFCFSIIIDTFLILISPDLFAMIAGKNSNLVSNFKVFENLSTQAAFIISVLLVLIGSIARIYCYWIQIKIAQSTGLNLTLFLNNKILRLKHKLDEQYEESQLISLPTSRVNGLVAEVIFPLINLSANLVSILTILAFITYLMGPLFLILNVALFSIYGALVLLNRSEMKSISSLLSEAQAQAINVAKRSISSNKDIILNDLNQTFLLDSHKLFQNLRLAYGQYSFNGTKAKLYIEPAILLVLLLGTYLSTDQDIAFTASSLVPLAIGAQRLIPLYQSSYRNIIQLQGGRSNETYIKNFVAKCEKIDLSKQATQGLKRVSNAANIIEIDHLDIVRGKKIINTIENFNIQHGEIVCVAGASGVGKTSFLDFLAGYYGPQDQVRYGNAVSKNGIVYHSQNAPLIDGTLRENMLLLSEDSGTTDLELISLLEAVGLSRLAETFRKTPSMKISESDGSLSGGQKQRLAFCRILLSTPGLYVLDEPFSSLDDETSIALFKMLSDRKIATIIITHQTAIKKLCSKIYTLSEKLGFEDDT